MRLETLPPAVEAPRGPPWATGEELMRRAKWSFEFAIGTGGLPFPDGANVALAWAIVSLPGTGDRYEVICTHEDRTWMLTEEGPMVEIFDGARILPALDLSEDGPEIVDLPAHDLDAPDPRDAG